MISIKFSASQIAPCGMNCGICMAYLREKNHCPGCRAVDTGKAVSVRRCKIKNCPGIKQGNAKYCFQCGDYPCKALNHLDNRYRKKYHMSMTENLEYIRENGIRDFAAKDRKRWSCDNCGGVVCVHRGYCSACGKKKQGLRRYSEFHRA